MPRFSFIKPVLIFIFLVINLSNGEIGLTGQFKNSSTWWDATLDGDPQTSMTLSSEAGEMFSLGTTVFKSKSRFKKTAREINANKDGRVQSTTLLDDQGRGIGQRILKESRVEGKVTSVVILRLTDRMIQGISAPNLKIALNVEKAHITCRTP